MFRRLTGYVAAAGTVGALLVIPATAAHASSSQCTTTTIAYGIDDAGDRGAPLVVPSTSSGNTACWLAQGDVSAAVHQLQTAMVKCNSGKLGTPYNETGLSVDSDYGPNTANAVRDMQYWGGIAQDGTYGQQTRGVMEWPTQPGWYGADCGGL